LLWVDDPKTIAGTYSRWGRRPMKKLAFVLGLGVGFVLGSRAGSGPYEQLAAKARSVSSQPHVQEVVTNVKSAASSRVDDVVHTVAEQIPETETG
jgi:hypothetical protein